jgi:hypothetical protein
MMLSYNPGMAKKKGRTKKRTAMEYVTQGTVQVALKQNASDVEYVVRINPTQDYAVKRNSHVFILFIPEPLPEDRLHPCEGRLFSTSHGFAVDANLGQSLSQAAIANSKVEIIIADSTSPPDGWKIQSIKIPASLPSDK